MEPMKRSAPASTYRLQFHKGFTFDDASAIAPYLWELGVSHVYSSPYLQAAAGSMHGYDVVDHTRVNDELGGVEAHENFSRILGENGLGQVLDIVPNHMAIGSGNRLWWDVLENGSASRYALFFDIEWKPQEERLRDKVLVPVLGDQYGCVLDAGEIRLARKGSAFVVQAAGQEFPVAPTSLPLILNRAADVTPSDTLSFIAASFARLPVPAPDDLPTIQARHRDTVVLCGLLERLCHDDAPVCGSLEAAVEALNADKDALDELLNAQNYRLAYWKTADQQLGYRRFFDVNSLIGLRMERPHVFAETHALLLDWLRRGVLDGVRVDHPDGLRDPLTYFKSLRAASPDGWIVGEKILAATEFLRPDWPIDGTSGYDFLNHALGVLIDPAGMQKLSTIYADFTGEVTPFPVIAHDRKIAVSNEALGSDVNRLANIFVDLCESHRAHRDSTRAEVRRAIRELAGCFAVYRSYVMPQRNEIADEDRRLIHCAVQCAKDNRLDVDAGLFDFMHQVLTLQVTGHLETEFCLRFQQFTSPVMAKGVEDTAFYIYNRLVALCEVGGDPARDGLTLDQFHAYQTTMAATHPNTMTTLSTHDTKRADDVRARLAVLSDIPEDFARAIARWSPMNAKHKTRSDTAALPDTNTEYFLYQTLIGAWPIDCKRTKAYMQKAMREAKTQTSWTQNNKDYEEALDSFIERIMADSAFVAELETFVARILHSGRVNSLAQTLLKQVAPGVPDLYQGSELWDHSLVDPDNRRPVNYKHRHELLLELKGMEPETMMERMEEGLPKLHLLHSTLTLRRVHPDWFSASAAYTPLSASGPRGQHVLTFMRADRLLAIVPLHSVHTDGWDTTMLSIPDGSWRNHLTGDAIAAGEQSIATLLCRFPVALLIREEN
jgi:(1->4)-alpha-D-glucan 1-alpha-D-glucosylmutase